MQLLEANLHKAARTFAAWAPDLECGVPAGRGDFLRGHDVAWCRAAATATGQLLTVAAPWGADPPPALGFERGVEPQPTPAMKVAPRV